MNIGNPLRDLVIFLLIGLISFMFSSCNESDNQFTLGNDFIESSTNITVVDTFSVEMSTVVLDSVPTSGTGAMLIGNYEDTLFGDTRCSSFFQIGLPASIYLNEDDIYDSISLIMQYSGYYYGDTNSRMQIHVFQLTDSIALRDDGNLYNTSTIGFNTDALGSIQFWPTPSATDSVKIKIKYEIGLDLFNKVLEKSEVVESTDDFISYFKGIAIVADESAKNTIIGFKAEEGTLVLRLYTHRVEQSYIVNQYDFPLVNVDQQFNQIHYDFSNTLLQAADNEKTPIPSATAGNKAFVQGYRKIMTKILFPTLPEILLNERGRIMKAELIFQPEKSSYYDFNLPNFVILYETNKKNRPQRLLSNSDGTTQIADLVVDEFFHEHTSYTFDLTGFINNELSDKYYDTEHALLISLYDETYQINLERIVIETKNPAPRLKLYYLTY